MSAIIAFLSRHVVPRRYVRITYIGSGAPLRCVATPRQAAAFMADAIASGAGEAFTRRNAWMTRAWFDSLDEFAWS